MSDQEVIPCEWCFKKQAVVFVKGSPLCDDCWKWWKLPKNAPKKKLNNNLSGTILNDE